MLMVLETQRTGDGKPARIPFAGAVRSRARGEEARIAAAVIAAVVAAVVVLAGPAPGELQGGVANLLILALAAVLLPGLAALAILRPWWGLLGWIALMPLLNVARPRLETVPVAITASTVMIVALAAGLLLDPPRPPKAATRLTTWARRGGIVLALSVLASTMVSADRAISWPVAFHGAFEPIALATLVVVFRPLVTQLLQLSLAMGASAAFASAYNIYRLGRFTASLADAQAHRVEFGRFTYYNVNLFGEILVIALPLLLAPLVLGRISGLPRRVRATILIGFVVSFLALYLTFSKGAWLGALAGLTLLFALVAGTWLKRALVVVIAAVVAMFIVPYPLYLATALNLPPDNWVMQAYGGTLQTLQGSDRLSSWDPATSTGEVSVNERALAWKAAVEMAVSHPLTGVGPGRFGEELATGTFSENMTRALGSAHNVLLNIAAELGLITVAVVIAFLATALAAAARAFWRGAGQARVLGLGLGSALVSYGVVSTTTGADLYEPYRVMNSDILFLALIVGGSIALGAAMAVTSAREMAPGTVDPGTGPANAATSA
jgi:O-antigen ligase